MKTLVCFVLFLSVCHCSNRGSSYTRHYGYTSKSQKHDGIERPCAFHDVDCIRRVFAHNSRCRPVKGPAPDPFLVDSLPIHLAHANVTFTLKNAQVRGLNDWKIKEFYINKATDKLVLEVEFNALTVFSPEAVARYYRKGKEPVELSDYSIVIYKLISLTLTVPNIKDLQLSSANVYSYIPDSNPPYAVGLGMQDNKDPVLAAVFNEMETNIAVGLKEFASIFMAALKSPACRGLKGTSVPFKHGLRISARLSSERP